MSDKMHMNVHQIEVEVLDVFRSSISQQNVALPVAAMSALVHRIRNSRAATWMQLEQELRASITFLKNNTSADLGGRTNISLGSGCELFMKYVTRAFALESGDFAGCKQELLRRGEKFTTMSLSARAQIAEIGHSFIQDGSTVLIHGMSRVVTTLLLKAAESRAFKLIVTEGRPGCLSLEDVRPFVDAGIPTRLITDSAVGVVMETVDLCLVGAEGVMENGGIVNKVGTYQTALVASALSKPFYVAVESYKFARMYPLSQKDTLQMSKTSGRTTGAAAVWCLGLDGALAEKITVDLPTVDFTPAKLITLLFTDLGVLTPAAVSEELIRLYQ